MECETAAELAALENLYVLNEHEQQVVFERKLEFLCRVSDWRIENERLGLAADLTDTWTPGQRERFLLDWNNDEHLLQTGCGEKRSIGEVDDGAGTSDKVSDNNFFTMTGVKQVEVKKFNTTGVDYTVQFTDTFAPLELSKFHDRLHEIFESLLNAVTNGVPAHDQVRLSCCDHLS